MMVEVTTGKGSCINKAHTRQRSTVRAFQIFFFIHYSACIKQALVYKQPQETNTCAFSDDLYPLWIYSTELWIYSTELWIYSGIYLSLILYLTPEWVHVLVSALNPSILFWILSRSFGEKLIFLQTCETKSRMKSLGSRLLVSCPGHVHLSVRNSPAH